MNVTIKVSLSQEAKWLAQGHTACKNYDLSYTSLL